MKGLLILFKDSEILSSSDLENSQIRPLQKKAFIQYMKSIGKLGGQNKTARLSNNRVIAEDLLFFLA